MLEVGTDSAGAFVLNGVLPGAYIATVRTASLDSVRAATRVPLELTTSLSGLKFKTITASRVVALLCPANRPSASGRGAVFGQLRGDASAFSGEARVTIEWNTDGTDALQWITTRANPDGSFRACGVPSDRSITLRASTSRAAAEAVTVSVAPSTRFASALLTLDTARVASAVFMGTVVLEGSAMQPVPDAEVLLPELSRSVHTNAEGRFRLSDLPADSQHVVVRKLGFTPVDARLSLEAHATIDRRVVLGRVSVIDSVIIRADPIRADMRDFSDNKARGIGYFITREMLEKDRGHDLSQVLRTVNGVDLKSINRSRNYATGSRFYSMNPTCVYFEDAVQGCEPLVNGICYMSVVVDNVFKFTGKRLAESVPNLSRYTPEQIEAIEIYRSTAEYPVRYSLAASSCGLVVIHTRR